MSKARLTVTDKSLKKDEPLEQVYSLTKAYIFICCTYLCTFSLLVFVSFLFLACFHDHRGLGQVPAGLAS